MLDLGHIELAGEAVRLRPLAPGDAAALAEAASGSRATYGLTGVPDGLEDAVAYIEQALADRHRRYPFAIEFQGRVAGTTSYIDYQPWRWHADCSLQRTDRPDAVEIGYTWLAAWAQRTRCNSEAKFLLLQHAFETWQVHRVSLLTDARNERSRRAIERLGAKLDGILRGHKAAHDCTVRDSAWYSILADEWPAVRDRLQQSLG